MTKSPVNIKKVNWFDGQLVNKDDMSDEQNYSVAVNASTINNFFGSGVSISSLVTNVIFETSSLNSQQQALLNGREFDGQNILIGTFNNVSDTINGVQLEVTLSDIDLRGKKQTKIAIIGDEFGDNLIHDDLIFEMPGTKITTGRYKNIRAIIFSDFAGNVRGSRENASLSGDMSGGYDFISSCVIRESKNLYISEDSVIASQTLQPSMFFNSFEPANYLLTRNQMLQDAIGASTSLSELNIGLSSFSRRSISPLDVTTKIGQKFLATGDNIQKISVLLASENGDPLSGNIVLTLYKLQAEVSCPVAPIPDNVIDFDPDPRIVAQFNLDVVSLERQGIILTDDPQIVDFVFTSSAISDPSRGLIETGNYYAFTIHRSGDTSLGTLLIEEAVRKSENGYLIVYDGIQWINITQSEMWYVVYGDCVKATDGIAYKDGLGVEIPKIKKNTSNIEVPYVYGDVCLAVSTMDSYNHVILDYETEYSDPTQEQRTGNQIYSRDSISPLLSVIKSTQLTTLLTTDQSPLLLGCVRDRNPRDNFVSIVGFTSLPGLASGNEFNILRPDADLLQNNLVGSILLPNTTGCLAEVRIIGQDVFYDACGDVNGDGIIDFDDLSIVNSWVAKYTYDGTPSGTPGVDLSNSYGIGLVLDGDIDILQFLRADVNGDGIVDGTDAGLISDYLTGVISSFSVGSTFSRMKLTTEALTDSFTTAVDFSVLCPGFLSNPFVNLYWEIQSYATWIPDLIDVIDTRRSIATNFTTGVVSCADSGRNDFVLPGNLILQESSDPDSLASSGSLYVKNDGGDSELFYSDSGGNIIQVTKDGDINVQGNTLEQSYNQGGSGLGRTINVNSGPVFFDSNGNEVVRVDGVVGLDEQLYVPAPRNNSGFLYSYDDSGYTELFYADNFGKSTQITSDGYLNGIQYKQVDVYSTTPVTLNQFSNGNHIITNEGATAQITFNLPSAVAGFTFTFVVQDSDGVKVVASTGDTIRVASSASASAGNITSSTVGDAITLVAINNTQWIATSYVGTWTVA